MPLREVQFRFVVGAQIEKAVQSGRSNLNARTGNMQTTEKQRWRSSLCVFDQNICSSNAGRRGRLALQAVYDRPKEDGREQEAFTLEAFARPSKFCNIVYAYDGEAPVLAVA